VKKENIKILFVILILAMPILAHADSAENLKLFNQLMPGKFPMMVTSYNSDTQVMTSWPAIKQIQIGNETFLVACYRDKDVYTVDGYGNVDLKGDYSSPIYAVFFKKVNGSFVLFKSPFLIKGAELAERENPDWVEVVPESSVKNLVILHLSFCASNTYQAIFDFENGQADLAGVIGSTTFDTADLRKDGEVELITTQHISGNDYEPPVIYRVVNGQLIDSGAQFPNYFQNTIDAYQKKIADGADEATYIGPLLLQTYAIIHDPREMEYGKKLEAEIKKKMADEEKQDSDSIQGSGFEQRSNKMRGGGPRFENVLRKVEMILNGN
jgi:hypothetical protein